MKSLSIQPILLLILSLWFLQPLVGQTTNNLDQNITIQANNVTISELLAEIGEKANIKFSYNPKLINSNKRVNTNAENKAVRIVLNEIFKQKFEYKLRGNYVIIAERKEIQNELSSNSKTILSGYIIDEETKDGVPNASIYTSSGTNSLTDVTGAFEIILKKDENSVLEFRKANYNPKDFNSKHESNSNLEIALTPIKNINIKIHRDSINTQPIDVEYKGISTTYRINSSLQANQENINDSINKPVSFSLYPGIATYGNLSGNINYNLALNLVGWNRGINGTELSLISSINRENVKGVQLAGISNFTGDNVSGFQAAGIINKVGEQTNGIQMAGISNIAVGNVIGAQFAGINNHTLKNVNGLQMGGIYNKSYDIKGVQMAGIINFADSITGLQASGIANITHSMNGVQLASIYNQVDTIFGTQISGLVNKANFVKGSQIGFINIADSLTGVPFGIFNFIKRGHKRIGVNSDELFPINIEFISGVKSFYTILRAGTQLDVYDNESSFYTYGLGFGSSIHVNKRFALEINATANHITKRNYTDNLSLNLKGFLGLEFKISKHFAIAGGATYNAYLMDKVLLDDVDFDNLRNDYLLDTFDKNSNNLWRSWMGYTAGVRYIF